MLKIALSRSQPPIQLTFVRIVISIDRKQEASESQKVQIVVSTFYLFVKTVIVCVNQLCFFNVCVTFNLEDFKFNKIFKLNKHTACVFHIRTYVIF